jgi:hypothetical protein
MRTASGKATAKPSRHPPRASANVTPKAGQKEGLTRVAASFAATADGEGRK